MAKFFLALFSCKMCQSQCPLGITRFGPGRVLSLFGNIINPLLAKLVCSRCLNIVFSLFFTLLLTSTSSRSIKKKSNKQTPTPTYYTQRTWRILSHLDQTCVSLYTLVKIGTRKVNSGTKKIIIDI